MGFTHVPREWRPVADDRRLLELRSGEVRFLGRTIVAIGAGMSVLKSSFDQFHGVKSRTKWTPEEDGRLAKLKGSGATWEDISEEIARPTNGLIHRWMVLQRRSKD